MLCIATLNLCAPSETFIREHINGISDRHVAVVFSDENVSSFDYPVHKALRSQLVPGTLGKLRRLWNLHSNGFTEPLPKQEEDRIVAFLSKHGVTAILAEYGLTGCLIRSACQRAKIPLFVHYHGWDASSALRKWSTRRSYINLAKHAAGFICPSRFILENLAGIGIDRSIMHVVPCGVDPKSFTSTQNRQTSRIVAVGRFVQKKAPHHTIDAFAQVCRIFPNAALDFIGDGPLFASCKTQAEKLGISHRIFFHGAKDHIFVRERMGEASLFVQHSVTAPDGNTEGLPVSVLEAMACEVPVVSTRHAGIPEAVLEGVTGYLVDEHDVNAMAQAMITLLRDPDLGSRMGKLGRDRVIKLFAKDVQMHSLRKILSLSHHNLVNTPDLALTT